MIGPANTTRLRIVRMRRDYNRWVADQTLEDFALRFTARSGRVYSRVRVVNMALGSMSFLALEAIGGTVTLTFGFANAVVAILATTCVIFAVSVPICATAARNGLDIDLLTRGAGFGYIGSTITSLIYATFTFIFFGIEAAIMATMLNRLLLVPLWLAYLICSATVVPLVTYGVRFISRLQVMTQPVWLALNILPLVAILALHPDWVASWTRFDAGARTGFDVKAAGAAGSIIFVLICQTAEQVDFLRFLPAHRGGRDRGWWVAMLAGGPGWVVVDAAKLLAGSLLATAALHAGLSPADAVQPAQMYRLAYGELLPAGAAVALTALLVIVSQTKINVTNAYAGSLAWSNFFSRLTHSHPGRVVYVVFNVTISLALMEAGLVDTISSGLMLYAGVAAAWMGAIAGHLMLTRPLGLCPPTIEFRRAYLPDLNPVGLGSMVAGALIGVGGYAGLLGPFAAAFCTFIAFGSALLLAPLIAWATGGRTFLARKPRAAWAARGEITCIVCEHRFEPEDMAYCPAYSGAICSLCCSLDARCHDSCKPPSTRLGNQLALPLRVLPAAARSALNTNLGRFASAFLLSTAGIVLLMTSVTSPAVSGAAVLHLLSGGHAGALLTMMLAAAIGCWLLVLSMENRRTAEEESRRQTRLLMNEIKAHLVTDAALQKARDRAVSASLAKSRYVTGISHELRSPLNAILGYAQLMEADARLPPERRRAVRIIRESGEHLTAIIGGLLDISKIEAGRLELHRDRCRLRDLMESLVQMMRPQAEGKGLSVVYKPGFLPAVVMVDEQRLRQVLINLLSNAVKFTASGEVTVTASWRNQIGEFVVADTGCGIAAADLERIFEPFERVAEVADIPGTGLGLTITRLLAHVLGGDVSVTSELGAGSSFRVRLMLSDVVDDGARAAPSRLGGYLGARRRVMVVDDHGAHRDLMTDLLVPLGFDLRVAADARTCLSTAADWRPDIFLLDLRMPGMDGRELVLRLRETEAGRAPIIFISANAPEMGVGDQQGLAGCLVLPKPLDLQVLLHEMAERLNLDWAPDPAPTRRDDREATETIPGLSFAQVAALKEVAGARLRAGPARAAGSVRPRAAGSGAGPGAASRPGRPIPAGRVSEGAGRRPLTQRTAILVIDDAPDTLGLLDEVLDRAGYLVLMAQSGQAAFNVLENSRPDIILIDAVMPGMDGLEVCLRLKSAPDFAGIPVIFMTGLTETEHLVRAFEAGAADYVTKPLQLQELLVRLQVHLTTSRRTEAARAALDDAGRYLFAVDGAGRLLWATPLASSLLEAQGLSTLQTLAARLAGGRTKPGQPLPAPDVALSFVFVGVLSADEWLLRVMPQAPRPEVLLRSKLGLTLREAEVLLWISYGKQTRDIAEILRMGPRTVDKHLEQIYNKLGVSNRASAAAVASRIVGASTG